MKFTDAIILIGIAIAIYIGFTMYMKQARSSRIAALRAASASKKKDQKDPMTQMMLYKAMGVL